MSNEDINDGLTDEERAALADDDDTTTAENTEQGTGDDKTTEEAAAAVEPPAAADAKPGEAAAAAAEQPAAESTEAAEAVQQQAPLLVAAPPEDAQAKLTEIAAKKDALGEKFDNGDLTSREFQKQIDELNKQERKIELDLHEFNLAQKLEQQRLQNDWAATCKSFVDANPIYSENQRLYKALDAEVKELANDPKTANWSGQKFLEEAHKNLKTAFKLPESSNTPVPPARRELPPNLAKIPSADVEDTSGGKFAVLDRMAATDPLRYEQELAKMPDNEREAYLAA
jgi:chromosome segregation ATPase